MNLDDLFFDLKKQDLVVGVSGGSDSMSLLSMLIKWNKFNKIIAITVDHRLREESYEEALQVKKWMDGFKIEHHILVWEKENKITSKIQELARDARYELISNFCIKNNFKFFLTAHHANDLIETFFMRIKKGSTISGLYPIKRVTKSSFGYIVRPLIKVLKCQIDKPEYFINDPSNSNFYFERVRIREELRNYNTQELNGIIKSLDHINSAKSFIEEQVLKKYDLIFDGSILDLKIFKEEQPFIGKEILKIIIKNIGLKKYFISPKLLKKVYFDVVSDSFKATTAGYCLLKKVSKDSLLIQKEIREKLTI